MNIVVRLLIGIPIFLILGWLWTMLFELLVAIVNGSAMGVAKLLRAGVRARGSNRTLGVIAVNPRRARQAPHSTILLDLAALVRVPVPDLGDRVDGNGRPDACVAVPPLGAERLLHVVVHECG